MQLVNPECAQFIRDQEDSEEKFLGIDTALYQHEREERLTTAMGPKREGGKDLEDLCVWFRYQGHTVTEVMLGLTTSEEEMEAGDEIENNALQSIEARHPTP